MDELRAKGFREKYRDQVFVFFFSVEKETVAIVVGRDRDPNGGNAKIKMQTV